MGDVLDARLALRRRLMAAGVSIASQARIEGFDAYTLTLYVWERVRTQFGGTPHRELCDELESIASQARIEGFDAYTLRELCDELDRYAYAQEEAEQKRPSPRSTTGARRNHDDRRHRGRRNRKPRPGSPPG